MKAIVSGGSPRGANLRVPGDKSIAHRWLMLAATADGKSVIHQVPRSLDLRSTAGCLRAVAPPARRGLEPLAGDVSGAGEGHGSTWNDDPPGERSLTLEVEGEGRSAVVEPSSELDCGNSGTSLRLLCGLLAPSPIEAVFAGDASLSTRPMERVAEPLREMGADVTTTDGHAPLRLRGGGLHGIDCTLTVPSAQVKGAILLAGIGADGTTVVDQPAPVRDHTERALKALGAPVEVDGSRVRLEGPFQHRGFEATVPGDLSSAAFLLGAVALGSVEILVEDVGLNPSRLRFVEVLRRMGLDIEVTVTAEQMGEPVGSIRARPGVALSGVRIEQDELPLVVDEVPILAALAAFARGDSWFLGAGELRFKESDRLEALVAGIEGLGGNAAVEGDDLVVVGGRLLGGRVASGGDHRIAMAMAICGLASEKPVEVDGIESVSVSYPRFLDALGDLGADVRAVTP